MTFRHGRPLAAYYYLPRTEGQRSHRSRRMEPGLVVDFDEQDRPIGVEITAPTLLTLDAFNHALTTLGLEAVGDAELAPLRAA
ncbi:MAG: DUF2283 domain-containing protein [Phycisphaerales bacterium]|nr:DUF2283 domain-containing protein [Phycisphaerae bacterium]NNM27734.1 DUF2283 domain-containing protein [Phycisphaerales bacterium]